MLCWRELDLMRWYPGCKATANGMITGYQSCQPKENDPDFGEKKRKWLFQKDIREYFLKLVLASKKKGKGTKFTINIY